MNMYEFYFDNFNKNYYKLDKISNINSINILYDNNIIIIYYSFYFNNKRKRNQIKYFDYKNESERQRLYIFFEILYNFNVISNDKLVEIIYLLKYILKIKPNLTLNKLKNIYLNIKFNKNINIFNKLLFGFSDGNTLCDINNIICKYSI